MILVVLGPEIQVDATALLEVPGRSVKVLATASATLQTTMYCCAISVSIRYQVNTGPVLPIPILIAILLTYIGSLCWEEQCVMTHWMAHHQFANNDHYLSLIFTFHNTFQLFMYFATGFFGDLLFLPVSLH